MKVKLDQKDIILSQSTLDALIQYMRCFIIDMRQNEPDNADCWDWGICTITDLANSYPVFQYGGASDFEDYTEEMNKENTVVCVMPNLQEECEHDYIGDVTCGVDIVVCTKCNDII